MEVPFVNLKAQYSTIKKEILQAIEEVLEANQFRGGKWVAKFEEAMSRFIGCGYAVGVGSGTDALVLALKAIGIREGDEVVTTPYSFIATASSIVLAGGKPVFADIEPHTYTLSPQEAESKITNKTKAIMPVHLFGQCADMQSFLNIAQKHSVKLIEDSAQAIGASLNGIKAGNWGSASAFSFYPTKNLGAMGEGGMVTTNDPNIYEKLLLLRCHGSKVPYEHELIGYNSHLDTIQSAVLSIKLKYLENWNEERRKIAKYYTEKMKDLREIITPVEREGSVCVYHQYVIRIKNRDEARKYLQEKGIGTAVFYPNPIHKQKAFNPYIEEKDRFPESEKLAQESLALPIYPELTTKQLDYVVNCIKDFLAKSH
ncbi:MAG: DegT/DnrJ/EryC1/StrS family aminotransferase [Candidatus Hydrogenedentes bacterium]|nr:DegT/DnrJ/EryC1/StrS family aminotransferase [Candidatus Hydrogenedentota bacterium]